MTDSQFTASTDEPEPPTPAFQPHDYQAAAIEAIEKSWASGKQRTAVVIPTGGGKTVIFSHVIARARVKTLVLAHREELIEQAAKKIAAVASHLKVGIVKAERDEHDGYDVVVASVQTLTGKYGHRRRGAITGVQLVVVDECHHAVAKTYRTVLQHFGCYRPGGARALGVTATMARSDTEALGDVWQEIAYKLDILDLIEADPPRLSDVHGIRVQAAGLDLRKVKRTAGDYNIAALVAAMDDADAWAAAADAYAEHAASRRGIAFTPTVDTAHQLAGQLKGRGITAEAVDGTTDPDERRGILARFANGTTQVVCNCGVLTEGYDAPWASAVLIARPTKSDVLYVQMAGRGLRVHPGKTNALIIDMVGVTTDKKLMTLACLTGREVGEVPDGMTLREAHEHHIVRSTTASPYLGDLSATEVDLFGHSDVIWPEWNGVRFVDIGNRNGTVYIAPGARPGVYDVIARNRLTGEETVMLDGRAFTTCLRNAEQIAAAYGAHLVHRDAQWRVRPTPASDKQIALLRGRFKITPPADLTLGQASELISARIVAEDFTQRRPRGYIPGEAT